MKKALLSVAIILCLAIPASLLADTSINNSSVEFNVKGSFKEPGAKNSSKRSSSKKKKSSSQSKSKKTKKTKKTKKKSASGEGQ